MDEKKGGGFKSAGWKHDLAARQINRGFDAAPPQQARLRIHNINGHVVVVMLVAPVLRINYIVCSFCGDVITWNTISRQAQM